MTKHIFMVLMLLLGSKADSLVKCSACIFVVGPHQDIALCSITNCCVHLSSLSLTWWWLPRYPWGKRKRVSLLWSSLVNSCRLLFMWDNLCPTIVRKYANLNKITIPCFEFWMRWREGAGVDLFVQLQRGDHISKLLETVFIMIMMIMYSLKVVIFMMMLVMFAQLQREGDHISKLFNFHFSLS